ncbi:tRNA dihydrouridine synthase [Bermanella sp. R86510]|uniref:tRNA dihydrouridine synthase n=1 Tax=unclassified Bermanella TaxID=2627862 RepID=UPI0037CA25BF
MQLILAPMEGLVDVHMRTLLTRAGHFNYCVTEFLRISQQLLPESVFFRLCPEAHNGWKTPSGTPVHLQLLGNDLHAMAENACRAAELGAPAININFGCPSRFVNGRCGGAYLLQYPEQIHELLLTIRKALPVEVPLTAKMRLGFHDDTLALENAMAMDSAGIDSLCIHARTKKQGYRPPAHWHKIQEIKQHIHAPLIANGEIWDKQDFLNCQIASGCEHIMIGRGAVANPNLAAIIRGKPAESDELNWHVRLHDLVWMLDQLINDGAAKHAHGRIKQWFSFLKLTYHQAQPLFEQIKTVRDATMIRQSLCDEIKRSEDLKISVY